MRTAGLLPLLFLLVSCATTSPTRSFYVGGGVMQHFMAPTNWNARNSRARLDITYRTGAGTPAIINISFFGSRSMPLTVSSVSLHGAGVELHLENISVITIRPGSNELRVTSTGDRYGLIRLLNSEEITLKAEIDGVIFIYTPERNFRLSRMHFLTALLF